MYISCSVTNSSLIDSGAHTLDTSVCFLYVTQNTELFTSRGCLTFQFFFFFIYVPVCGGLKSSLPPLFSTFLSLLQQHRKMGHEEKEKKKKWQRKTEMRSNLILIWFLLGSCFNPLWAGFFFFFSACVLASWVILSNSQGLEWRMADSHHSHHTVKETRILFCCNQQNITLHAIKYRISLNIYGSILKI